ncbi:MAG TPA: DNA gyrase inhibitor YacG [Gammaproteobacteria bacterium]|nr:DNA gyrase inhibitor YacG [Gammaproteobacteria bacterium]
MKDKPKIVNCPQCGESVEWKAASKWRPFCSKRCHLIDLGAWASEEYSVASEPQRPLEDGEYS